MVEYVKSNIDPLTILNYYGFNHIVETDSSIRCCCAIHGGDNPNGFVWNKSNNLWFCYTGNCGGGDVFSLIQRIEDVNFETSVRKAADILNLNVENMTIIQSHNIYKEQQLWLKKMRELHVKEVEYEEKIPYKTYSYDEVTSEIKDRFKEETFKDYDAKFCNMYPTPTSILRNKLVIPIIKKSKKIGVALRDTTGHFIPKWMFMPKGIKTSNVLYNLDKAIETINHYGLDEIILVEGIFDVWAFHEIGIDNVVAIFGSTVSEKQYVQLMKLNVTVTLCFDGDQAGKKCTDKAIKLFKNKSKIKLIEIPEGSDADAVGRDNLKNLYLKRTTL